MNKLELEFCRRYDATVQEGQGRHFRQERISYFDDPNEMVQPVTTVPSVDISMPVDRFRALIEIEDRLKNLMDSSSAVDKHPGSRVWEEYQKEAIIRHECPSVKIAYEKYQSLLNLVKSNYE